MASRKRQVIVLLLAALIIIAFFGFVNYYINSKTPLPTEASSNQVNQEVTKTITAEELKKYDGTDPKLPIYIALDGLIYDVTAGSKFYTPGGPYHYLAGKDSSAELHLIGGDIIKRKYPVVGKLTQ